MLKINSHSLDAPPKELPTYVLRLEVQRVIEQYAKVFQCPKDFITSAVYCIKPVKMGRKSFYRQSDIERVFDLDK